MSKYVLCFLDLLAFSIFVLLAVGVISGICFSKDSHDNTIVLSSKNLLVLNSEVDGDSVGALINKAKELSDKSFSKKPIYLFLNTPGGSVQSGLELIEALKGLGRPVHTITSFSASMGWQIAQALGDRDILQSGIMMSHRAAGEFSGSFGGTTPSQLDQRIRVNTQVMKEMDMQTVKRTNGKQTLESYQKAYANELWVTGQEAVAQGYADNIVTVRCDYTLSGFTSHSTTFMGVNIGYDLSNCPINGSPMNIRVGNHEKYTDEYVEHVKKLFISNYSLKASQPLPLVF